METDQEHSPHLPGVEAGAARLNDAQQPTALDASVSTTPRLDAENASRESEDPKAEDAADDPDLINIEPCRVERVKQHISDEKWNIAGATLGVVLVFVVLGVPVWWHLTTYRVALPYRDIDDLSDAGVRISVPVRLLVDARLPRDYLEQLASAVRALNTDQVVTYMVAARRLHAEEQRAVEACVTERDLVGALGRGANASGPGEYTVVATRRPAGVALAARGVVLTPARLMLVFGVEETSAAVAALRDVVVQERTLRKYVDMFAGGAANATLTERALTRKVKSHGSYDVTFTLIDDVPEESWPVAWDIEHIIEARLRPLLASLKDVADFRVTSQVLYFTSLGVRPKPDPAGSGFVVAAEDVPLTLNHIESRLASHTSTAPALNFIVFVPRAQFSPLYLDPAARARAFLSPRWGGLFVYNVERPPPNRTEPPPHPGQDAAASRDGAWVDGYPAEEIMVDMSEPMAVFADQLRTLLGVPKIVDVPEGVTVRRCFSTGDGAWSPASHVQVPCPWEKDAWKRTLAAENVLTAAHALSSLSQLLATISNIVINDEIGAAVYRAVDCLRAAHRHLLAGPDASPDGRDDAGGLTEAFRRSKEALRLADKAFFDASLLELLYFPDDQKFAIYVPLFVPVIFPVVMSVVGYVSWVSAHVKTRLAAAWCSAKTKTD